MSNVIFKWSDEKYRPTYETPRSTGADLKAATIQRIMVPPGATLKIPLGLYLIEDPHVAPSLMLHDDSDIQIRPRSGLSSRGILSHFGTVDLDFRGEFCAILTNLSSTPFEIRDGDRVAQLVISRSDHRYDFPTKETVRGDGGFGSTGV